jgi:8-oxo-dGTP diphosphatase
MSETIQAAGGVVWRETPEGLRVAVVHRSRYDDWTLPKGKVQGDESLAEAAQREVTEETGCRVRSLSDLGEIHYTVAGQPKSVRYWQMMFEAEDGTPDPDEVAEVIWMTPVDAIERLQYPEERRIMTQAMSERGITPPGSDEP